MEFACGFVYVPPVSQRDGARANGNVFKRSALLPPRTRPQIPPPPPPVHSAGGEAHSPNFPRSTPRIQEPPERAAAAAAATIYENEGGGSVSGGQQQQQQQQQRASSPRRTALLPPHMKPPAAPPPTCPSPPRFPPLASSAQVLAPDAPPARPDPTAPSRLEPADSRPDARAGAEAKLLLPPPPPPPANITPSQTAAQVPVLVPALVPVLAQAPALPPRPPFMKHVPEYVMVLPSSRSPSPSSQKSPSASARSPSSSRKGSADGGPLPGNPNVLLVSLGKLLSEERAKTVEHEPTFCPRCGAVLDSCYYNVVNQCDFCKPCDWPAPASTIPPCIHFLLNKDEKPLLPDDALLLFCIDVSGSMSITSQVTRGDQLVHRSRLQFVQEAVVQCVQRLSEQQPDTRVGLITFNHQVTLHGHESISSRCLSGAELSDSDYLKREAAKFPSPPPLAQTMDCLQRQVKALSESGATALGPAALLSIAVASRQPGSKVIICTDGKANTELGNLEVEDDDARTLLSSTIFYQQLGEYAANQGVAVSVLSIEGTDCRLDELGRLADRTGGKVVISSPNRLHPEFEEIIENRTIATHCAVTLLLPTSLRMKGEKESGHKGSKEVGNVALDTEITFQFGANDQDGETPPPAPGSRVSIQLQIRFRLTDGRTLLRVLTASRDVTDDSAAALSSLSLAIIQLNSSQASAALAVRGRFLDARREGELQKELIERAIEHNHSAQDEAMYQDWVKTMEPIYCNIHNFTRRQSVTDSQSLTDAGAALLYAMKHSNRKSITRKNQKTI